MNWKTNLGQSKNYEWAFDYYYSSPTIAGDQVMIGSKDGFVYNINKATGEVKWKFKSGGIVRSTPAVADNTVYVGDTDGSLFAIDLNSGKQVWRFFTAGHSLINEKFGYDRRAIIASPVIKGNKVFVGGRDGYFYAIDKSTGKQKWRADHQVSWVISSVAIKDSVLVTGTSDGHFVQALNINTGKQIWKYNTIDVVWSSPIIDGDKVYAAGNEGVLYCLDLKTGAKIDGFQVTRRIFSSPVIAGSLLYFGADDGYLYALKSSGKNNTPPAHAQKYIFFDNDVPSANSCTSLNIRQYLAQNGYKVIGSKELIKLLKTKNSANNSVIVFATNYFPEEITKGKEYSLLRNYLNSGGKTVVLGINPLIFKLDVKSKSLTMRSYLFADSVLGIKYGPDDLRSFRGHQPAFPTKTGKEWGLRNFWVADFSIPQNQVSIVLGSDENGLASAWVKKFNKANGSGFVQIWSDENKQDLNYISRVAENGLK